MTEPDRKSAEPLRYGSLSATYRGPLMAFFSRRQVRSTDAEDMIQEVFLRLIATAANEPEHSGAYIFQIASNLLKDRYRREHRQHRTAPALEVHTTAFEELTPLRFHEARETLAHITRHLAELPEMTRNLFVLFRLEGIPQAELAETYGISVRSVQKHILKAMQFLLLRIEKEEVRHD
ncbi:MAG: sigma-70 family RNA polymerase sigma factor [Asticcacaulis sp.]|uniref:RNA polymerase sigma factor n=1 Tax=Asticcacaulis sp. TaxID=1872648 RepID=UPI0039E64B03